MKPSKFKAFQISNPSYTSLFSLLLRTALEQNPNLLLLQFKIPPRRCTTYPHRASTISLSAQRSMRIVNYEDLGGPEVLKVHEIPVPTIKDDEVLIKVTATGVNIMDIDRRLGELCKGIYLGYECSGVIYSKGKNVVDFTKGNQVCAILKNGGGYAEFVAVPAIHVLKIPHGVSLLEAAVLPQAACLTMYCLSTLRFATLGKKILIHGAAGGVGVIALQYAKCTGSDVFAVVGTQEKLQTCKSLGAKVCINSETEDFCERVKAETGGRGVDIIIDVNGRDYFHKNLDCLATGGSLIIIGYKSGEIVNLDLQVLYKKDIDVLGANLRTLPSNILEELLMKSRISLWPLISDGHIKPLIGKTFSFSEAADAHRAMEKCVACKVLLVPGRKGKIENRSVKSFKIRYLLLLGLLIYVVYYILFIL